MDDKKKKQDSPEYGDKGGQSSDMQTPSESSPGEMEHEDDTSKTDMGDE